MWALNYKWFLNKHNNIVKLLHETIDTQKETIAIQERTAHKQRLFIDRLLKRLDRNNSQ